MYHWYRAAALGRVTRAALVELLEMKTMMTRASGSSNLSH